MLLGRIVELSINIWHELSMIKKLLMYIDVCIVIINFGTSSHATDFELLKPSLNKLK